MQLKRAALYARVSTSEQSVELQLEQLECYRAARGWRPAGVFTDTASGAVRGRPGLERLMQAAKQRQCDVVLVWRFDRFARSVSHLVTALDEFRALGVDFVSYQEQIDTGTPLGQALFTMAAAMAQLERDIIRERVVAGLRRAQERGKPVGRPKQPFDIERALKLKSERFSVRAIADRLKVSPMKVSRALALYQNPPQK